MLTAITLAAAMFISSTKATYDDMNEEDFVAFVKFHDDVAKNLLEHAEAAAEGCVKGAAQSAVQLKTLPAVCIGCAVGAAGELAVGLVFGNKKD